MKDSKDKNGNYLSDEERLTPATRADKVWRWSYQSYLAKKDRIMFSESKKSPLIDSYGNHTDWNVYEKKYEDEETDGDIDYNLPDDVIYDYLNSSATAYLNNMGIDFPFSKPWELIAYLIDITEKPSDITAYSFLCNVLSFLDICHIPCAYYQYTTNFLKVSTI